METEQKYRVAPPGFTLEQWETFNKDGIIFIEDAISDADIQTYIDAIDRAAANNPVPGATRQRTRRRIVFQDYRS